MSSNAQYEKGTWRLGLQTSGLKDYSEFNSDRSALLYADLTTGYFPVSNLEIGLVSAFTQGINVGGYDYDDQSPVKIGPMMRYYLFKHGIIGLGSPGLISKPKANYHYYEFGLTTMVGKAISLEATYQRNLNRKFSTTFQSYGSLTGNQYDLKIDEDYLQIGVAFHF